MQGGETGPHPEVGTYCPERLSLVPGLPANLSLEGWAINAGSGGSEGLGLQGFQVHPSDDPVSIRRVTLLPDSCPELTQTSGY